jgi:predicted flap endonuclease-1-like 5' DNA nuclease
MLTVVIALVCFAVAFVGGGILSKAYFVTRGDSGAINRDQLQPLLQAQRVRYRKRIIALKNVIQRHEEARDQIREKLTNIESRHTEEGQFLHEAKAMLELEQKGARDLQQQLAERDRQIAEFKADEAGASTMGKEFGMLRIERDELAARISRIEAKSAHNETATVNDEDKIARMRADMGELRETLATRDRRIHDLEHQLQDSTDRTRQLQGKLDNWKQRVSPLTRKLKEQKQFIQTLHRNDDNTERPIEVSGDNLKAIRGIGPALERRLKQHGIHFYRQLAELTVDELADISHKLAIAPNLPNRDGWIRQARDLQQQTELCETA